MIRIAQGDMTMLYEPWCENEKAGDNQKQLWKLTERVGGRAAIEAALSEGIRSHYDDTERIAEEIRELGYPEETHMARGRLRQCRPPHEHQNP